MIRRQPQGCIHANTHTQTHTHRQTDRQTDKQTDRQTHTDTHTHTHTELQSPQNGSGEDLLDDEDGVLSILIIQRS